nr:MAG TPA: hypothetical protein [Caudoviricetes sp.]DAP87907.1 MAG TPA: hypothetical protein [Caudoviricetes sp.]
MTGEVIFLCWVVLVVPPIHSVLVARGVFSL